MLGTATLLQLKLKRLRNNLALARSNAMLSIEIEAKNMVDEDSEDMA
jgi:hypothetical protein